MRRSPWPAVDGLRLFYSGVPIFGTLLAMWFMRDYDLDEKRALEVHAELERRTGEPHIDGYPLQSLLPPPANRNWS